MVYLPFAQKMPIDRNFKPGRMQMVPNGLAIHVTDGVKHHLPNLGGVKSSFNVEGAHVSAHFCVAKDGTIAQFVDTNDIAFAVGGDHLRDDDQYWYSIENIAFPGEELTPEQVKGCGQIYAWFNVNFGLPLKLALTRFDCGLGYHAMFKRAHPGCPGPKVIAQRDAILDAARGFGAS